METRQITQIKHWFLILNPMRANTEAGEIVAASYDRQRLIDWYEQQKAPQVWMDSGPNSFPAMGDFGGYSNDNHKWHKTFNQGSPLEWYNPADASLVEPNHFGHGIHAQWIQEGDLRDDILLLE